MSCPLKVLTTILPPELVCAIVDDVKDDLATVAAVSRTCRYMHSATESLLYRHAGYPPSRGRAPPEVFLSKPQLARHIHSITILLSRTEGYLSTHPALRMLCSANILRNLINLQEIHLSIRQMDPPNLLNISKPPFQLRRIVCYHNLPTESIASFTASQKSLHVVSVEYATLDTTLFPSSQRNVTPREAFGASESVDVRRSNGLKTLVWRAEQDWVHRKSRDAVDSLQVFSSADCSITQQLEWECPQFINLRYLRVGVETLAQLEGILSQCPNLVGLIIRFAKWRTLTYPNQDYTPFFKSCKNLEFVDIELQEGPVHRYERYEAGLGEHGIVSQTASYEALHILQILYGDYSGAHTFPILYPYYNK